MLKPQTAFITIQYNGRVVEVVGMDMRGVSVNPSSNQFGTWQLQVYGYQVDSTENGYIIASNWIITR